MTNSPFDGIPNEALFLQTFAVLELLQHREPDPERAGILQRLGPVRNHLMHRHMYGIDPEGVDTALADVLEYLRRLEMTSLGTAEAQRVRQRAEPSLIVEALLRSTSPARRRGQQWRHPSPMREPALELIKTRADFAAALNQVRTRAGLTIHDIATETGLTRGQLSSYFGLTHLPAKDPAEVLFKILAACEITTEDEVEQWQTALARARRQHGGPGSAPVGIERRAVDGEPMQKLAVIDDLNTDARELADALVSVGVGARNLADARHRVRHRAEARYRARHRADVRERADALGRVEALDPDLRYETVNDFLKLHGQELELQAIKLTRIYYIDFHELLSRTTVTVWEKWSDELCALPHDESYKYTLRILSNHARNLARCQRHDWSKSGAIPGEELEHLTRVTTTWRASALEEIFQDERFAIYKAISQLDSKCRDVMVLIALGLENSEIRQELGMTVTNLTSTLGRARKLLREMLDLGDNEGGRSR